MCLRVSILKFQLRVLAQVSLFSQNRENPPTLKTQIWHSRSSEGFSSGHTLSLAQPLPRPSEPNLAEARILQCILVFHSPSLTLCPQVPSPSFSHMGHKLETSLFQIVVAVVVIEDQLMILKKFKLQLRGVARTQTPTTTNYDVGSTTWVDLRRAPLLSAMEITSLGHEPS
ncbi:hypothetical protein Lal_00042247 [Lupinus albus]|nr:hypothetical protein Lal_00042247 [Lupinus albus]